MGKRFILLFLLLILIIPLIIGQEIPIDSSEITNNYLYISIYLFAIITIFIIELILFFKSLRVKSWLLKTSMLIPIIILGIPLIIVGLMLISRQQGFMLFLLYFFFLIVMWIIPSLFLISAICSILAFKKVKNIETIKIINLIVNIVLFVGSVYLAIYAILNPMTM